MLEGSRGAGYMGDIALDDLFLNTGICPPSGMNSYILHDLYIKISSFSMTCWYWLIISNSYVASHNITKKLRSWIFTGPFGMSEKKCYEIFNPLVHGQTHLIN